MGSPKPKVSGVMTVYNERPYLEKAVQSVLDQTFDNFEFIIVNDGSTDGSKGVIDRFEKCDERIRPVHQENRSFIASLNRGIDMAEREYIARTDGDDISHPERFERQVNFLDENPEFGILGTQMDEMDADGNVREDWKRSLPTDPDIVVWQLLFNICLCHPTVVARRCVLEDLGGYAESSPGLDYELLARAVLKIHLVNSPNTLFKHRRHENSVSVRRREKYTQKCARVAASLHRAIRVACRRARRWISREDGTGRHQESCARSRN